MDGRWWTAVAYAAREGLARVAAHPRNPGIARRPYATFIANSGRYRVAGDQLSHRAYLAKDPNHMADFPDNALTATVHRAGDTLHWTWNEGFMDGVMFTMRRVEGTAVPWMDQ